MTALIVGVFLLIGGFGCGVAFSTPVLAKLHGLEAKFKALEATVAAHEAALKKAL